MTIISTKRVGMTDVKNRVGKAWEDAKNAIPSGSVGRSTVYGIWLNKVPKGFDFEWFGEKVWDVHGRLYLPAFHNLAVDSGLETAAKRSFNISGPPAAVAFGGVDNNTTAVAPTTSQFDTTSGNRFITAFDNSPIWDGTAKKVTANFTVSNANTTITHRRYGLTNSSSNTAGSLFSMLSGFILDFNGKNYDLTISTETFWTGT